MTPLRATAPVLVLALALAGCASGDAGAPTTDHVGPTVEPTGPETPAPTGTPTSTEPTEEQPTEGHDGEVTVPAEFNCEVEVVIGRPEAAAGSVYYEVTMTHTGTTYCEMPNGFALEFVSADGAERSGEVFTFARPIALVSGGTRVETLKISSAGAWGCTEMAEPLTAEVSGERVDSERSSVEIQPSALRVCADRAADQLSFQQFVQR